MHAINAGVRGNQHRTPPALLKPSALFEPHMKSFALSAIAALALSAQAQLTRRDYEAQPAYQPEPAPAVTTVEETNTSQGSAQEAYVEKAEEASGSAEGYTATPAPSY